MKQLRKALIFCLILVSCSYFVFKAQSVMNVSASTTTTSTKDNLEESAINSEYRQYVNDMKKYHRETVGKNENGEYDYFPQGVEKVISTGSVKQTEEDVDYTFTVSVSGFYNIHLDYTIVEGYKSSMERILLINGEVPFAGADTLTFSRVWVDNLTPDANGNVQFAVDTNENHRKPQQVEKDKLTSTPTTSSSYVKDYMGYETAPYKFYFEKDKEYTLTFRVSKEPMQIDKVSVLSVTDTPSYSMYLEDLVKNAGLTNANETLDLRKNNENLLASVNAKNKSTRLEAEFSSGKSSPTLYPTTDRSSSKTYPFSYTKTYLNAIGGSNWKVLGDWIEWSFEVPEDGYYNISMRAKQNSVRGMYSSRIVYVDGEVLFDELNDVQFSYTSKWQNVTLGDEDGAYYFYFKAGETHTIRMEVTMGQYSTLIERIQEAVNNLNKVYRDIISYTTITPDANRDYQLKERFPNLKQQLIDYANELTDISNKITEISGTKSDKTGVIDSVVIQLEDFVDDELRSIPTRLSTFSNNISSLGSLLSTLREYPLMLDYIEVHTPDVKLDKANENFFRGLWDGIVSFFVSFFVDYSSISETESSGNADVTIEVWMTQGRDQANVIRNLIDTDFSKSHPGIKVELKLTAADVLLKSTLAGIGPDVALNVDSSLPVNYALRNAVSDLTEFIYEKDASGAIKYDLFQMYNEDGTPKKDSNGNPVLELHYVVKDKDFGFVWNGETYKEAVVRRYAEVYGVDASGNSKAYSDIDADYIPSNFYMESSLSQFQFYYDTYETDSRNKTTGTYALPEKQIFLMMFVRDDIMDEKGLSAHYDWDNMTWDDVINLVAELQTDQLQFYLPVNAAGDTSVNPIFLTLLYQRHGSLYISGNKENGLTSAAAMDAFEQWTDYYTMYSFPKSASFVNRFRTGEMPIGISYYELYNTLSVSAPELKGKWSFHLIPGTMQSDGTIDHTAVASGTGCVMLKQPTDESDEIKQAAWEFMKWWSSFDAQSQFGTEMEGILGSAARHATANVKALNALAWPKTDLEILMKQWEQSREIPQIAGSYITGREIQNAYRQVINKSFNPREVLFEYADTINNEIDRKRKEFDLELRK